MHHTLVKCFYALNLSDAQLTSSWTVYVGTAISVPTFAPLNGIEIGEHIIYVDLKYFM